MLGNFQSNLSYLHDCFCQFKPIISDNMIWHLKFVCRENFRKHNFSLVEHFIELRILVNRSIIRGALLPASEVQYLYIMVSFIATLIYRVTMVVRDYILLNIFLKFHNLVQLLSHCYPISSLIGT